MSKLAGRIFLNWGFAAGLIGAGATLVALALAYQ